MKQAVLALGANLGPREETLRRALDLLNEKVGRKVACSSFYETEPSGFISPHLFLNAVAVFDTSLEPEALIEATESVERLLGRKEKSTGNGYKDREVDIDIIFLGNQIHESDRLCIPHPHYGKRRFVLEPLCEILPDFTDPKSGLTAKEQLHRLNRLVISPLDIGNKDARNGLNMLLPVLTPHARLLSENDMEKLISTPGTTVYLGRDENGMICATATLCLCLSPTGCKAWMEDVVTAPSCQGRGYGAQMVEYLQNESVRRGAKSLNLTSSSGRETARRLYVRKGFAERDTKVYRWTSPQKPEQ